MQEHDNGLDGQEQPLEGVLVDDTDYSEAEALVFGAEAAESKPIEDDQETVDSVDAENSARGLVRAAMHGMNWLLRLKDSRVQYGQDVIQRAEDELTPALVKHGIGSTGITRFGEEFQAGAFLIELGLGTASAIRQTREADEAAAKKEEGGFNGSEPQRLTT
ncbi:hypothetical protein [Aliamphritea ceti]|uniref:hypothetical protein n=1 Tax=Aliamphritea ceti TaxID=1524258 RepID=UPI0021C3AC3F|nr:hypothetical protein [Aliamphritea ceti]